MSVGDVNSSERGTGARYNDDKVDLTLLPPVAWEVMAQDGYLFLEDCHPYEEEIGALVQFWEGDNDKILEVLDSISVDEYEGAARVFAYGAIKYAKWNWAKGMPWSVPMACYLRHTLLTDPESEDVESGMPHRWHAVCNLIMLGHYAVLCPDMDDRPQEIRAEFHRPGEDATAEELGVDEPWDPLDWRATDVARVLARHDVDDYIRRLNQGWEDMVEVSVADLPGLLDLATTDLNNLVEALVEEQESRERILRATGQLRGEPQ